MELVALLNFISWNFHFNNRIVMKGVNFILLLLLLISCSNRNNSDITSFLKEWEQKEILFPKNMYFTTMLKDTIYYNLDGEYKILTYVDSIGCTSCKLQLPAWDMLIKEMDSLYVDKVNFIFVFSPHRVKDIRHAILTSNFNYPVCVDDQDSIAKLNNFPSDSRFHTFLLDKNNTVIAIGNPVYNPKIKELYLKIILGNNYLLSCDKRLKTSAGFDRQSLNMGEFDWKQEQISEVLLNNLGEGLLVINNISTSCGCISVEYSKEPIRPRENIAIKVKYKADHLERFNKTITVYCNTEDSPLKLRITGNAK